MTKKHWRSQADFQNTPEFLEVLAKEFPSGAKELEIKPGMERRKFLELLGGSMALAGIMSTGCIRRPKEYIYPETNRPENTLPGVAKFYSTSALIGSSVLGLSVTSTDGRPTKIDGNSRHPMNNPVPNSKLGSSNAFVQAEILNLYDSDRGQACRSWKKTSDQTSIFKALISALQKTKNGEGIAFLVESLASPSYYQILTQLRTLYPKLLIAENNTTYTENRVSGATTLVGKPADIFYDLSKADVILALDSDFLGVEGDTVKNAREFSERRKQVDTAQLMNRLYSVESHFSITGANADHRYALNNFKIANVLVQLVSELKSFGLVMPKELDSVINSQNDTTAQLFEPRLSKWIKALAKDLFTHKNNALVVVGNKQPAWLHSLGLLVNQALGALNRSVHIVQNSAPSWLQTPSAIAKASQDKKLKTLVMIGGNPVFTLPADLNFKNVLQHVEESFYLGMLDDDTAHAATHYMPKTHFLESWGDTIANNGTYSIRQPLIAPLFEVCVNEYQFVSTLLNTTPETDYQIVRAYCKDRVGSQISSSVANAAMSFDDAWKTYLSVGVVTDLNVTVETPATWNSQWLKDSYVKYNAQFLNTNNVVTKASENKSLELVFALSNTAYDGRYANNPWMQELPDPISKLVWDNALLISPKTARKYGLSGNPKPGSSTVEMVTLSYNNRTLDVPVWEVPGTAEGTCVLHLGFGSQSGRVAKMSGFNANQLRTSDVWFGTVANIQKNGHTFSLVTTQEHGSMIGDPALPDHRTPAVRTTSLSEFIKDPSFVLKDEVLPLAEQKSMLFPYPKDADQSKWARQQWGMSIDLNSCIGCNACTIACQAENNISVVGKERVFQSRVMNWIRIDRYFTGDLNDPEVQTLFQPLNCQHCENAPCEAVCPVAATSHSPDGLNEMTYNRCVGTRYCANNCPYKVRRFNFFNFSEENDKANSLYAMQKNPNVTVRFRGVMEKCTYCVHKINAAKSKTVDGLVPDGAIVTACQSVCPTNAIVFGNVADSSSAVSKLKALPRNYGMLGELNTRPRTTYLAKIRNVNPEIG